MAASRSLGKIYREEDAVSVSGMTAAEAGSADDDEEGSRPIDEEKLPTEDRVGGIPMPQWCCRLPRVHNYGRAYGAAIYPFSTNIFMPRNAAYSWEA